MADFDKLHKITSKAFDDLLTMTGQSSGDPEMDFFESLSEDEFGFIGQQFGEDALMEYIRVMEAKRMGVTK